MKNIKKIPIYNKLFEYYNNDINKIIDAGYFDDNYQNNIFDKYYFPITPLNGIFENNKKPNYKKKCILLSSGCFNPIHEGHLNIMLESKKFLESKEYNVLGGYFCPAHDNYIKTKTNNYLNINERSNLINEMLKVNNLENFFYVDKWPAIFLNNDINFTFLIDRIKKYIYKFLNIDVEVFYICGGDNANFYKTFELEGNCIVVNRDNNDKYLLNYSEYLKNEKLHNRIYFINTNEINTSSTIKRENPEFLNHYNECLKDRKNKKLKLRVSNEDSKDSRYISTINILEKYYRSIEIIEVEEQKNTLKELLKNLNTDNIISLDSLIPMKNNLEISRGYDLGGYSFLSYLKRPGAKQIETNKLDRNKEYYLFDDDIFTGGTIRYAKGLLKDFKIIKEITFNNKNKEDCEILDIRDFYIGNKNSGLVIKYNDNIIRLPYIYPFVCLKSRCSISKIEDAINLSLEIFKINKIYFNIIDEKEIEKEIANFLKLNNLNNYYEFCEYYIKLLEND